MSTKPLEVTDPAELAEAADLPDHTNGSGPGASEANSAAPAKPRRSRGVAPAPTAPALPDPAANSAARPRRARANPPGDLADPAPAKPRRSRRAVPLVAEAPSAPTAPAPFASAEIDLPVGVRSGQAHAAHYWDARPEEPLYELELEVRTQAERGDGQSAAMGNLAAGLIKLVGDNLRQMSEQQGARVREMLSGVDLRDYLDPAFWQGIGMVLRYQIDEQTAFFKRRMRGDYTTDAYGMDRELIEIVRPFLGFMYRTWWRVEVDGLEHVPGAGRALLVSNHSGVLPWDGAMIASAVIDDHPQQKDRIVRSLHLHWFSTLPVVAPALAAMGQVPGIPENAVRLLEHDELVCVFPEGLKGVGKLFKDRYKLARFGRGGFVQAALRARAPIVPVAVVGAEEIYPMFVNLEPLAKLLGFPYFPLTPFFPWLGPLGMIPLPTRWSISFCPPLPTADYGPEAADDPLIVLALCEQVRSSIQETIDAKLATRTSIF